MKKKSKQATIMAIKTIIGLIDSVKAPTSPPIHAPIHHDISMLSAIIVAEKPFGENFVAAESMTGRVRSSLKAKIA